MEGNCQEGGAQEVPDGGQVGDGHVVRIIPEPPYEVNHPVTDIQKDDDLQNVGSLRLLGMSYVCVEQTHTG